ncbi:MAG: hypothetical protein WAW61_20840 [Methylococcaceae bacterium]
MHIFVGGSIREVPRDVDLCHQFVVALGAAIATRGHVLLNGCKSSLDQEIAIAAQESLMRNRENPKDKIISYCLKTDKPVHSVGTIRYSALLDWEMSHSELVVPEQIEKSDATIFIAGSEGTFWAKNWAIHARKLVLGIPRFGGAGETIYSQELKHLRDTSSAVAQEYEALNSVTDDMSNYAMEVVSLVERMVLPRNVFTIMSFKEEFIDVFDSCKDACKKFDFVAERTDESKSMERILPRIELGIQKCAFVIADVSGEPSPNVFYEVGYAKGLGKNVILIAKKGTKLPFDITDFQTIFWETQRELKEQLQEYIGELVGIYGRQ